MPDKQAGIALPDPTQTVGSKCTASCVITGHIVAVLHETAEFWSGYYALLMEEGRDDIRWRHIEAEETSQVEAWSAASTEDACRMGKITRTGGWLSVPSSVINGKDLGVQEWKDALFLRYGIKPPNLPKHCNGCGMPFEICHALDCKNESLIMARHNNLCDGVADLSRKAFTPTHVCDNPKVYTACAVHEGKDNLKGSSLKYKGYLIWDLLIRDL